MIRVEPGSFRMGGPGDWDEQPAHTVTVTGAFCIAEQEVTEEEYRRFDPSARAGRSPPYVSGIGWEDAVRYCRWLSEKEGRTYRLPTEAEWEYAAARAPGIRNMESHVAEWVHDWHGEYPRDAQTDPVGPDGGYGRVIRGGGPQDLVSAASPRQGTDARYRRIANRASAPAGYRGRHWIGFRLVQGDMPSSRPWPRDVPFVQQCVRQSPPPEGGPEEDQPWFRQRSMLPVPPENMPPEAIRAAGFHPGILGHNHSPGLEVLPNGDLLALFFSASTPRTEYWPDVSLVATRLRYGSEEWDPPDYFIDFADLNNGPVLLWREGQAVHLFLGGLGMPGIPFLWTTSRDNWSSWEDLRIVTPRGPCGGYTAQPVNTAFRGADGTMYLSMDGLGATSLLWASRDNGETWFDTGGRTAGRHTAFVPLKDGRILGIGGKNSNLEGYSPRVVSRDGGRTWGDKSKTPFPALASNQRPALVRLASGRLFFASDFQDWDGKQPAGERRRGSFVALSDDEGATWTIKPLPGALPHEDRQAADKPGTLGYAVARQAPDGVIHLITTMNHPAQHFELNEAWILGLPECGRPKRHLLNGRQVFRYPGGRKQYEVTYREGRKTGRETYWSESGRKAWERRYEGGTSVWTRYWPDGAVRSRSTWKGVRAVSIAGKTWAKE